MAAFDADIQLRVLTEKAFKSIDAVERRIGQIEDSAVELKVNGLAKANRAVESLKKNFRTLGKIGIGALGVEGVGAAAKALNDFGDALANTERASGLGSNAINAVLDRVSALGNAVEASTAPLAGLFDGLNSLAAAGDGTGLAIGAATASLLAFSGPIEAARKKVQELVLGVNSLDTELKQLVDVKQAGRVGILGEIERQLSEAKREARELNSETDEYLNTLRRVVQLEAERTAEARKRQGLQAAETARQGIGVIGTGGLAQVTQQALPSAEMLAERLKESGQEVQRLSAYYGDLNVEIDKGTQDADEFARQLQVAADRSEQLPPIFNQVSKSLEKVVALTQDATQAQQNEVKLLQEAREIAAQNAKERQAELQARKDAIELQERSLTFETRLNNVVGERNEKLARSKKLIENFENNFAAGVGFPLLFGAGPGAILGGAAGSFGGFGPQILVSAIGQQIDALVVSISKVGQAFNTLKPDLDQVAKSLGVSGTAFEEYLKTLEEAGDAAELNAEINRRLAQIVGQEGANALQKYGDDLTELQRELDVFFTQVAAGFAKLFGEVLEGITRTVAVNNAILQAQNSGNPELQGALGELQEARGQSILGGGREALIAAEDNLLQLVRDVNAEEERRAELLNTQGESRLQEIQLLDEKISQVGQLSDLTDDQVYQTAQELLLQEKILDEKALEAEYDAGKIRAMDLVLKLKEIELGYERDLLALKDKRQALLDREARDADRAAARAQREADRAAREQQRAEDRAQRERDRQEQLYQSTKVGLERQLQLSMATSDLAREKLQIEIQYAQTLEKIAKIQDEARREELAAAAERVRNSRMNELFTDKREPLEAFKEETKFLEQTAGLRTREVELLRMRNELLESTDGTASIDEIERAVAAREKILNLTDQQIAKEELLASIYQRMGQALEDSIVAAIESAVDGTQSLAESLQEITSSLLKDLGRLLIRAGISSIAGPGGMGLPGFASGGVAQPGAPALVGESGPEIITPLSPTLVTPFDATREAVNASAQSSAAEDAFSENAAVLGSVAATMASNETAARQERMASSQGGTMTIQTQVINNVEYATIDQVQKASAAAAKNARARVFSDLKNKPSARAGVGL